MPETQGTKADGMPISDELIEAMADEAERGYDVEEILRRSRGGRPPMGVRGVVGRVGASGPRAEA